MSMPTYTTPTFVTSALYLVIGVQLLADVVGKVMAYTVLGTLLLY